MSREATTFNIEIIFFQRKTLITINILTHTVNITELEKKVYKCIYQTYILNAFRLFMQIVTSAQMNFFHYIGFTCPRIQE